MKCLGLLLAVMVCSSGAFAQTRGIHGRPAQPWSVPTWTNLPEGKKALEPKDFAGKVVYLYCFQSWCPGCHSSGFPTLKELMRRYKDTDDVEFIAVQTAFEGHHTNTPEAAVKTGRRYDLDIPIGHAGSRSQKPRMMANYRTGGTPWTIVIDRNGVVRYNDFHITPDRGQELIDKLRKETWVGDVKTLPKSRGGQEIIGTKWPDLDFDASINATKNTPPAKVTLYRWWTNGCPWCEATLPAIEELRKKYEKQGLRTVAVYHPKPPRSETPEEIRSMAEKLGYHGEIASDLDWSELKKSYLSKSDGKATSVTILVDEDGVVRFVHPGPVFFPSEDSEHARENADHALLEQAIRNVLR